MKAAKMKDRPRFDLMHQNEPQNTHYMQMPVWLFTNPKYADLSLDAKVTYTLLLNRFQLSSKNGWINELGEVFVIFPRKALAEELHICEQRITAAFRTLINAELIWEKRCGRGFANQIYLARVASDPMMLSVSNQNEVTEKILLSQEAQNQQEKNSNSSAPRASVSATIEQQNPLSNKIDIIYPDLNHTNVSQSITRIDTDDDNELTQILAACELDFFPSEIAKVFENAIERLYYSERLQIGHTIIPKCRIRKKLLLLDNLVLRSAERKIRSNVTQRINNSTAYVMAVVFNCITEFTSDLMVDPYLNSF